MFHFFRGGRGGGGGYGGQGGYQRSGYSNGYQRYDGPYYGGRDRGGEDFYDDRYGGGSMNSRMRPYPMPYDRPAMGLSRDDYGYSSSPYSVPSRDPYSRPSALSPRDLYERRNALYGSTSDYLYSRRSPPQIPNTSR
ncbi:hypothetical protein NPIL_621111 [Nephila pilipes]|uniref:Uncharacterized protein n=1 Tax=Nephila pilipes TaxID=299642 RepID=A0A8X6NA81_NEPPI|nr:hypothetical protein NPIL_621111 [Nephila pilipes]